MIIRKTAVVSRYRGTLPDHNELSVAEFNQSGRHTVIVLDSMWKAPFLLDIYPQQYSNPSKRDFTVSNATYEYVEISFCYATVFRGTIDIPVSNPVFSRAEIIPSSDKTILRLYLKSRGKFYGWDSYYNDNGQLCFEFLNPINTVSADNVYGVDLTGARVLIDAGHGGVQPGTVRGGTTEAERNLSLAYKVKSELESIGATVIMMRTGNYEVTSDERRQFLKEQRPDYCISIHHNAANSTAVSGFEVMHFNAFSSDAAKMMYRTAKSGVYSSTKLKWYYFFLMRITTCPVVLTENGYFTNDGDYNNIINEGQNAEKAKKIVQGIADYFISIQYVPISEPSTDTDLPSNPDNVTDSESSQPSVSEEYAD